MIISSWGVSFCRIKQYPASYWWIVGKTMSTAQISLYHQSFLPLPQHQPLSHRYPTCFMIQEAHWTPVSYISLKNKPVICEKANNKISMNTLLVCIGNRLGLLRKWCLFNNEYIDGRITLQYWIYSVFLSWYCENVIYSVFFSLQAIWCWEWWDNEQQIYAIDDWIWKLHSLHCFLWSVRGATYAKTVSRVCGTYGGHSTRGWLSFGCELPLPWLWWLESLGKPTSSGWQVWEICRQRAVCYLHIFEVSNINFVVSDRTFPAKLDHNLHHTWNNKMLILMNCLCDYFLTIFRRAFRGEGIYSLTSKTSNALE